MSSAYLDTNIFLNVIYKEPKFGNGSAKLLARIQTGELSAVTSSVTILEMILDMANSGLSEQIEISLAALQDIPYLTIIPLDATTAKMAAKHVIEDGITVHDAYHLATSLSMRITYFVTRDTTLQKKIRKYARVVSPEDIMQS